MIDTASPTAEQCSDRLHSLLGVGQSALNAYPLEKAFQRTEHSLFCKANPNNRSGVTVEAPSFDADLHVETTTIMFADVVESVRLIEQDELGNVIRIQSLLKQISEDVVPAHNGKVLEHRGDGLLISFRDARSAATCAIALHEAATGGRDAPSAGAIALRIGINSAALLTDTRKYYGRGMNITARIAGLANPGETIASSSVRDQLVSQIDADIDDLGECYVKHLDDPIRAFRISRPTSRVALAISAETADVLRPTIAIVPPGPISGSGADGLSAEVFADCIIAVLSKVPELRLLSRLSTRAFQSRAFNATELRLNLRADYALVGTARFSGEAIVLMLQLLSIRDDEVVWAEQVKGTKDSLLDADSALVAGVCTKISAAILEMQIRVTSTAKLPNVKSYSLLLAGIGLLHRQQFTEFARARQLFEALAERHPRHAAPYAWQAAWRVFRVTQGWFDDLGKEVSMATDLARRAVDVDPDDSLSHTVSGLVSTNLRRDFSAAEASFSVAIKKNRSEPLAWLHQGALKAFLGDGMDAFADSMQARRLSPLDPWNYYFESLSASAAFAAGDFHEAIRLAASSLRANRMHVSTLRVLAMAHAEINQIDEARHFLHEVLVIEPSLTVSKYLNRSPSVGKRMAEVCASALKKAGLPE